LATTFLRPTPVPTAAIVAAAKGPITFGEFLSKQREIHARHNGWIENYLAK